MIGDGFGGCTITLMDVNEIGEYEKYLEEYEHIFGFKADYFICETAAGIESQDAADVR
jgi:galactokinase